MKYETPDLTALTPAISAIQGTASSKQEETFEDGKYSIVNSYSDWE